MQVIIEQITQSVGAYIPNLVGALAILIIGWLVARVISVIVGKALRHTGLGKRLAGWMTDKEGAEGVESERLVAKGVFWLIMLFVLIAVFQVLGLTLITEPLNRLLNEMFQYAPRLLGAGLLLLFAWIVATVLKFVVTRVLTAVKIDERLSSEIGKKKDRRLPVTKSIAEIVYWLVFLFFLPAVLGTLGLEGLLQPVQGMLDKMLSVLPHLFAAALLLVIAWFIARIVQRIVTNLLTGIGFNSILVRLGVGKEPTKGERTLSEVMGYLVLAVIMLFAIMGASRLLGFTLLADMLAQFTAFTGHVVVGLIILALGLFLANLASNAIKASKMAQAKFFALAARIAILVLVGAMALRQMGLANEIINLAFGLLLGAIAVAVALAFGLGGREIAAREIEGWLLSVKSKKSRK